MSHVRLPALYPATVASFPGRIYRVKRINANNATSDRCYVKPVAVGTIVVTLDAPECSGHE
jgi:hypothetical protein